jgi:glycosyltransferase involved in cell wall biosynthesis
VDDGSTDRTPEKIAAYGDRVRYVRKANGGQASAFNTGIPLAQGDIIALLDGDDWWHPGKLRSVVDALSRHPQVMAVGHGLVLAHEGGPQSPLLPQMSASEVVFNLHSQSGAETFSKSSCFFGTSRLAVRRHALLQLLPVPEALIVEADEFLFTLLPAIGDVLLLREAHCYYRIHDGNLFQFSGADERRLRLKMQVMNCLAAVLPPKLLGLGLPDTLVKRTLAHTLLASRRLTLTVDGGPPGAALPVEIQAWRLDRGISYRRLPAKILMILLALVLPARLYYKLRGTYGAAKAALLK